VAVEMVAVALGELMVEAAAAAQLTSLVAQEPPVLLFLNGDKYESTYSN
jgi:hypothetical protein